MSEENKNLRLKERVRKPVEERARQNLPINSHVKSERVYAAEPITETCWAYMKLLRENSAIKSMHEVDPYAEVYHFRDNMYAIFQESLDGMGDVWSYLIIGPEKAMLVDTGFGVGDLKGLCDELTGGKELIVVNTHGHFDHAYGNCRFDRVYCHEYEAHSLQSQNAHIWDYLFQDDGTPIWAEFDRNDLPVWKDYEIIPVPDGYTWDLGSGYEIELIFLGGHSTGHAAFLDKTAKNLYCGDDFISMRVGINGAKPGQPYGEYATVRAFAENVEKLNARLDEIDHLFPGHFVMDLEASVIPSMLQTCKEALADPFHGYAFTSPGPRGMVYQRHVEGLGTLAYTENSVGI